MEEGEAEVLLLSIATAPKNQVGMAPVTGSGWSLAKLPGGLCTPERPVQNSHTRRRTNEAF